MSPRPPNQYALSFEDFAQPMLRENYVVSEANKDAITTIDSWMQSSQLQLILCGGPAAGKTHLASIISIEMNGTWWMDVERAVEGAGSDGAHSGALGSGGDVLIVDDAHLIDDPQLLFRLIEASKERNQRLVLVGRGQPIEWARALKDLETRLEAMPRIHVPEPDEALLLAVVEKLFADRQLKVSPAVCKFAVPRLPRTFEAARAFVRAAEAHATENQRPITKLLAGNVIKALSEGTISS